MRELFWYQQECLEDVYEYQGRAGIVQMATGLGKTVTYSRQRAQGKVLVLAGRQELVRQPIKYYEEQGIEVGIEGMGERSNGEQVVIASVPTLSKPRNLKRFAPDEFDTIITDECHHAAAPTYMDIYDHFTPRVHIGYTATPNRQDGRLGEVYDDIISKDFSLEWGIRNNFLVDIECEMVDVGFDANKIEGARDDHDFTDDELANQMNCNSVNSRVVTAYEERCRDTPTIIFGTTREHCLELEDRIPGSRAVLGNMGAREREKAYEGFRDGSIRCLISCGVLTEGVDFPFVENIVIARPTKSIVLYTQMVGRGVRRSPETGKQRCLVLDCGGSARNGMLCKPADLLGIDLRGNPDTELAKDDICTGSLISIRDRLGAIPVTVEGLLAQYKAVDLICTHPRCQWFIRRDSSMEVRIPNYGAIVEATPIDRLGGTRVTRYTCAHPRGCSWVRRFKSFDDADRTVYESLQEDPMLYDSRWLWNKGLTKAWEDQPASERQRTQLSRYIHEDVSDLTKGQANKVLNYIWSVQPDASGSTKKRTHEQMALMI